MSADNYLAIFPMPIRNKPEEKMYVLAECDLSSESMREVLASHRNPEKLNASAEKMEKRWNAIGYCVEYGLRVDKNFW